MPCLLILSLSFLHFLREGKEKETKSSSFTFDMWVCAYNISFKFTKLCTHIHTYEHIYLQVYMCVYVHIM